MSVKLFPCNLLLALSRNGLNRFLNLILSEIQFKHIGYFFQIVKSDPFFSFTIDQSESLSPSLLCVSVSLNMELSTMASVSRVKNCQNPTHSPSRATVMFTRAWQMNQWVLSQPRVLAVAAIYLTSACLRLSAYRLNRVQKSSIWQSSNVGFWVTMGLAKIFFFSSQIMTFWLIVLMDILTVIQFNSYSCDMRSLALLCFGQIWRGVGSSVREVLEGFAHHHLLVNRLVVEIFACEDGFRVDVVAVFRDLKILMDPVAVLLNHVAIEFVCGEFETFPPSVCHSSPPCTNTCYSKPAKVLVELSLIDLSDSVSAQWYQTSADLVSVEEEHGASQKNAERTQKGVSSDVALQEIVKVPGQAQP